MRHPVSSHHLLASLLLVLTSVARASDPGEKPNFVIILADDMGYGDASCYGGSDYRTPHLDALAASGMRFTDFHSNGAVCSPTRTALLTGRYQQRAGIEGVVFADPKQNRHHGLHTSEPTFAKILHTAGYATGCFGKWHVGYEKKYNPTHHGFDRFRGYVSGNIDYHSHHDRMGVHDWWHDRNLVREKGYSTHLITRHAIDFIEASKDRPFCAYIAHEAPHTPFQGPRDPAFRVEGKVVSEKRDATWKKRAYREMMVEMDRGVGDVVATLERLDLDRRTLVFFFSDNGATRFGSNGKLRGNKGSLWEGGHRVPAIASWPGRIAAGSTCDELAIGMDLLPTMAELAGTKLPAEHVFDGRSIVPLLDGAKLTSPRRLFWRTGKQQAMRDGRWKIVVNGKGQKGQQAALFDLRKDIRENRDVSSAQAERVRSMLRALAEWRDDVLRGATVQPGRRDARIRRAAPRSPSSTSRRHPDRKTRR